MKRLQLYTNFIFCFSFWGTGPQTHYRGFTAGPHWGTPSQTPGPATWTSL